MGIKFGTDGWRAIIAEDFTFDNVRVCAQAVANYMKEAGLARRGLLIGYDTRFASEDFAAATAEVVAANGIKVSLCTQPTPTPVISFSTQSRNFGAAVIITASHNPRQWNGFKIKSGNGMSAPPEVTEPVEKQVNLVLGGGGIKRMPLKEGRNKGLIEYVDLAPEYMAQVAGLVDLDGIRKAGLKVAVDSMCGAGCGYTKMVLGKGATKVAEVNGERNPSFPGMERPEPIAVNLGALTKLIKRQHANIGLSTDGDADRVGIMDENGEFLNPLQVFALLTLYFLEVRGQRGPIVKTVTTGNMISKLGQIFNVPVYETPVGFRWVAPKMEETGAFIGGEESGGCGFRGHVLERDGVLAGILFLDFMVKTGKTPSQLLQYLYSKVGPHFYDRIDVDFKAEDRQSIMQRISGARVDDVAGKRIASRDSIDGFRFLLEDGSWFLIRLSGTEPLLRLYSESKSPQEVKDLLQAARKIAGA